MRREKGQHRATAEADGKRTPQVFLKRAQDGTWRKQWVGRWSLDGKRKDVTLCRWKGVPPSTPQGTGDAVFERSRERAQELFEKIMSEDRPQGEELRLTQKVHSLRYGGKVGRMKIADLRTSWDALPHKADLSAQRRERVHSVLRTFERFMSKRFPNVTEVGALTADHFKTFFESVDKSGVSSRTWNDVLEILRGTLRKVDGQSRGFREYLAQLPRRSEATVHRRPFAGSELEAIFAAAAAVDPELRPVLVAAACTALRRGDVARLQWDAVDLADRFITVKTAKTGETVEIPIFPPLLAVLQEANKTRRQGVPYVFPQIALAYQRGPGELDRRLRKVLAAAGFVRPEWAKAAKYPAPPSPEDAAAMVEAGMRDARWSERRRKKGLEILKRHFCGEAGRTIAAAMKIARGAVSVYLNDMEKLGQIALVSPPKPDTPFMTTLAEPKSGETRKHRGSLCGWHSFRTTFCTLALANGVSIEILQKITGHRTAEIVLKHYDRRGREAMRKAIGAAMPKAIAGGVPAAIGAVGAVGTAEEFEAVPADVAKVARMLAAAAPATLAKVKKILQKGGDK